MVGKGAVATFLMHQRPASNCLEPHASPNPVPRNLDTNLLTTFAMSSPSHIADSLRAHSHCLRASHVCCPREETLYQSTLVALAQMQGSNGNSCHRSRSSVLTIA